MTKELRRLVCAGGAVAVLLAAGCAGSGNHLLLVRSNPVAAYTGTISVGTGRYAIVIDGVRYAGDVKFAPAGKDGTRLGVIESSARSPLSCQLGLEKSGIGSGTCVTPDGVQFQASFGQAFQI